MNSMKNFNKLFFCIIVGLFAMQTATAQQNIVKQKDVIGSGATNATTSDNSLHIRGTVGQAVIDQASSTSGGIVNQGFWTPDMGTTGVEVTPGGPAPEDFVLDQNYPNPYSAVTLISFAVPSSAHVVLQVYSMTGMLVKTLVDDNVSAGKYNVTFDASDLSTGSYLYTLQSGAHLMTKRMVVIR